MTDLRIPDKRFRPEIEGVRAVAAFLVAVYHIWLGTVSGGVDVFFIVSGYLITTSLLTKIERAGHLNITEYLLGLARRLVPLAFTVLLFTIIFSYVLLPQAQWGQMISEILASALYFQNWELANNAVDYLAQNNEASPLQHFWALSIQGQFYITWPLIILLAFVLAKKGFKNPLRKTLLGVLTVVFVSSFSYSIYITTVNQPLAYFDTFARVWEFSIGGIVALLLPYIKLNKTISFIFGWAGLAVIALTGLIVPVSDVFPGYAALLPITGVILIIIAADSGTVFGVHRLLGSKPFVYFGSISYAFYLWHWPILIFYFHLFNREAVSVSDGMAILVISFMLSVVSVRLIEAPVRTLDVRQAKKKLITRLLIFIVPVLVLTASWSVHLTGSQQGLIYEGGSIYDFPGAQSISDDIEPNANIDPMERVLQIDSELPSFYDDPDCYTMLDEGSEVKMCSYGETEDPDYTIALVGGSHSGHWFPALENMSEQLNMEIVMFNKDGCRFTTDDFNGALSKSCMEWNENVIEPLNKLSPDLIVTTANVGSGRTIPEGYLDAWGKVQDSTEVLAIRDSPIYESGVPSCLEAASTPEDCEVPRDELLSDEAPWENTDSETIPNHVTFADMSEFFCDDDTCYPIIGNVITFRDNRHISTLYSMTMAPALKVHVEEALNSLD